jgi:hypothetical protein
VDGVRGDVQSAWDQLTGRPLAGEIDKTSVIAMKQRGDKPTTGTVVSVTIPDDAAAFDHRRELVYLPPTWYADKPSPRLPAIMMVGGNSAPPPTDCTPAKRGKRLMNSRPGTPALHECWCS